MIVEIGKNSFPWHLWDIYRNGYSGVLRAERKNLWKEIYFEKGIPVGARSNILKECLGRLLVEFGKLSGEACEESLILMKGLKKRQGEALIKMGLLKEEELPALLRFQLRVRILGLFGWKDADYRFKEGEAGPSIHVYLGEEIGSIMINGLKERAKELKKELLPFKEKYTKKRESFDSVLKEFGFEKPPVTSDGRRVDDILSEGEDAIPFLYALLMTGALELADLSEEVKRLSEFHDKIKDKNHFEILGLVQGCKDIDVKKAYYRLAKIYHPDLYETNPDKRVRSLANELFCQISSAYEVLFDENSRREYEERLKRGNIEGDATTASRILLAEMEFKKGQAYLRTNNFDGAFKSFQTAVDMNPEEAEFYVYLGWSMYNRAGKTSEDSSRAREYVTKGISINPRIAMAYYFLGFMNRVEGNLDAALKEFDRALRHNPDLVEPLREIRLINMRKAKEEKEEKGVFGKMFGRKQ